MRRPATKVEDERQNEQAKDSDNLDTGEDELGFAVDGHGKDVQTNDQDQDNRNPCSDLNACEKLGERLRNEVGLRRTYIDLIIPVSDYDGRRRNLCTQRDGRRIPILLGALVASKDPSVATSTYVPTHGKTQGVVDVAGTELRNRTGKW